jgi:hypothetical protein
MHHPESTSEWPFSPLVRRGGLVLRQSFAARNITVLQLITSPTTASRTQARQSGNGGHRQRQRVLRFQFRPQPPTRCALSGRGLRLSWLGTG